MLRSGLRAPLGPAYVRAVLSPPRTTTVWRVAPPSRPFSRHAVLEEGYYKPAWNGPVKWIAGNLFLVASMVCLGGRTRLTESGLSMTYWSVSGSLPPVTEEAMQREFDLYKESPEYKILNRDMELKEFARIFYYEYTHRMLGRLIGAAWVLPFAYYTARGRLPRPVVLRGLAITALIGAQGAMGWYMVKSGLKDEYDPETMLPPRVSQYRLAAHLGLAFSVYALMCETLCVVSLPRFGNLPAKYGAGRALARCTAGGVFITAMSGAFVAGLDAGLLYGTFPRMGESYIPDGLWSKVPLWTNIFDNDVMVQFEHRYLGITTFCLTNLTAAVLLGKYSWPRQARKYILAPAVLSWIQVTLGIKTITSSVDINIAGLHQLGALCLLHSMVCLLFLLRGRPIPPHVLKQIKQMKER